MKAVSLFITVSIAVVLAPAEGGSLKPHAPSTVAQAEATSSGGVERRIPVPQGGMLLIGFQPAAGRDSSTNLPFEKAYATSPPYVGVFAPTNLGIVNTTDSGKYINIVGPAGQVMLLVPGIGAATDSKAAYSLMFVGFPNNIPTTFCWAMDPSEFVYRSVFDYASEPGMIMERSGTDVVAVTSYPVNIGPCAQPVRLKGW